VGAPADGYTLLLVNSANAINATLYEKLNFNFIRDIPRLRLVEGNVNVVTAKRERRWLSGQELQLAAGRHLRRGRVGGNNEFELLALALPLSGD
jgi:Tripartite tricarboxylate transporter family receptor